MKQEWTVRVFGDRHAACNAVREALKPCEPTVEAGWMGDLLDSWIAMDDDDPHSDGFGSIRCMSITGLGAILAACEAQANKGHFGYAVTVTFKADECRGTLALTSPDYYGRTLSAESYEVDRAKIVAGLTDAATRAVGILSDALRKKDPS